jgi:hypothetical protein
LLLRQDGTYQCYTDLTSRWDTFCTLLTLRGCGSLPVCGKSCMLACLTGHIASLTPAKISRKGPESQTCLMPSLFSVKTSKCFAGRCPDRRLRCVTLCCEAASLQQFRVLWHVIRLPRSHAGKQGNQKKVTELHVRLRIHNLCSPWHSLNAPSPQSRPQQLWPPQSSTVTSSLRPSPPAITSSP